MPVSLASSRALFPLRVKYGKVTLFIPVESSTPLSSLKKDVQRALVSTRQVPPSSTGFTSFEEMDPETDFGFFDSSDASATGVAAGDTDSGTGNTGSNGTANAATSLQFENVQDTHSATTKSGKARASGGGAELTVGKIGWRDEVHNVTYLGFKSKDATSVAKPVVQIPSLLDYENEDDAASGQMATDIAIPRFDEEGNEMED